MTKIETIEGYIERLEMMLQEERQANQQLRNSYEQYVEREKELRHCLKFFVSRDYYSSISFEEAIRRAKRVLDGTDDPEGLGHA